MTFDPFSILVRLSSERLAHRLIRFIMALVCLAFLVRRLLEYHDFFLKPLWAVETLLFVILTVAFLRRDDPVDRAVGFREVLVPLVGALLPFGLLLSPPHSAVIERQHLLAGVFWVMTAGTALTAWGMWSLRRAFSITVEARRVVFSGPYRYVRHPVYLGEMMAAAAVAALRASAMNVLLFLLFVAVQLARSRWEERKLLRNFAAYGGETGRAWWFWGS